MDEARRRAIEHYLRGAMGDGTLRILGASLLSGGAIQQNWALDVEFHGATQAWVLRTDNAATLAVSLPRAAEYALLRAARAAGVTVPEPLLLCEDPAIAGAPFFVMRRVAGIAAGHRVVKSETLGGGREALRHRLFRRKSDHQWRSVQPGDLSERPEHAAGRGRDGQLQQWGVEDYCSGRQRRRHR